MAIRERRTRGFRVKFERPLEAGLMAIDGTWRRDCRLIDVSATGAKIEIDGPAVELKEFFLMLSRFGNPVFRRCKREWVDGSLMGVGFQSSPTGTKPLEPPRHETSGVLPAK
jgi:hypothetical protein